MIRQFGKAAAGVKSGRIDAPNAAFRHPTSTLAFMTECASFLIVKGLSQRVTADLCRTPAQVCTKVAFPA